MYTGNGSTLSELAVFEENYALLCNTIIDVVDPLMKYCVGEKYFLVKKKHKSLRALQ